VCACACMRACVRVHVCVCACIFSVHTSSAIVHHLELGSQRVGEQHSIIDNVCQCILVVSHL